MDCFAVTNNYFKKKLPRTNEKVQKTTKPRYKILKMTIPSTGKKGEKMKTPIDCCGRSQQCEHFPNNLATSTKDEMQAHYNSNCTHHILKRDLKKKFMVHSFDRKKKGEKDTKCPSIGE